MKEPIASKARFSFSRGGSVFIDDIYEKTEALRYFNYLKYKRCQGLWFYCNAMWHRNLDAEIKERLNDGFCDSKHSNFYSRWVDRWKALAQYYKEHI